MKPEEVEQTIVEFANRMEKMGQRFQLIGADDYGSLVYIVCDPVTKRAVHQDHPEPGLPTWPPEQLN